MSVQEAVTDPDTMPAEDDAAEGARPGRAWSDRLLVIVVGLALAAFALLGIGSPLLGQAVFAGTDELVSGSPYNEMSQFPATQPANTYIDDTWDTAIPHTVLFADELRDGRFAAWNPYVAAGAPLGATMNYAVASPVTVPFYLLPGWLAPGFVKLLEIVIAVGGSYLFLRRLRLRPAAALLGGLVFASSAFMVVWTNWPQTRVAAFIPAVFWALELILQGRRVRGVAALALVLASMIFGGFPAVTGYTLATAGPYLLVRALAEHRSRWRPALADLAAGAAGVLAGVLLTAVQLIPWAQAMSTSYVRNRGQTPNEHLSIASLVTTIAPWALGSTDPGRPPYWYQRVNMIESMSYLGAAALVLVLAAIVLARRARAALPAGVWPFLVAGAGGWFALIYLGGPPLAAAQHLPLLFASNFIGRSRSVLGFLLAVLAAVGLELLLRRRAAAPGQPATAGGARSGRWRRWDAAWGGLVVLVLAGFAAWAMRSANKGAFRIGPPEERDARLTRLATQLGWGLLALLVAAGAAGALWWLGRRAGGRDRLRLAAAAGLALLVGGQALTLVVPFYPRADPATFYPLSGTHQYLREHLGHDRYASESIMSMSAETANRIRSAGGHTFVDARYGELVREVPGSYNLYPTYVQFDSASASSPVLDRISARYFVEQLEKPVLGDARPARGDGGAATLTSQVPVVRPVDGSGPIRAVLLAPTTVGRWGPQDRIEVVVRDAAGTQVARTERRLTVTVPGTPLSVPVAADAVPAGTRLTAAITLHARWPLTVEASGGVPAVGTVRGHDDGLRLVDTTDAAVYQRLRALPRLRWAGRSVVEPDPARRLALLATGTLGPDQVVLDRPDASDGGTATVTPIRDGTDEVEVRVAATGAGHLVLADAIQHGWSVTVDGAPAKLTDADHAFVAVAVPGGEHTIRFRYAGTDAHAGAYLTVATALALIAMLATAGLWRRRRPGQPPTLSSAAEGADPRHRPGSADEGPLVRR